MNEFFLTIVNMGISAGWIVLAVIVLRILLKTAPKWINVILWGIVGARLICPFSFQSSLSLIPSNETIPTDIISMPNPNINSGIPFFDATVNGYLSDHYSEGVTVPVDYSKIIITTLSIIWILGIITLLIYALVSFIRIKNQVKEAVLKCENVWICDKISTPFILGIIKPKIYLPFNMSRQDTALVLAHEKSHISRKDYLWKPLGFIMLTLHWFNPLMWLAYVLLCRDIELACDEKVIKELNNDARADYSEALLNCSINRRMITACPLAFGEVSVKERVITVLNYKKPAFWIIIVSVIAVIVASICLLTNPKGQNLQNIEWRDLTSYGENTDYIIKYDGEVYETISSFNKDKLYDLLTISISKNETSPNRSKDRDQTHTIILQHINDIKNISTNPEGLYICFNKDFTEVWVNDSVKPTLSYRVLNPKKAEKIYNNLCSLDNSRLANGSVQFYNEPTNEHNTPIIENTVKMSVSDLALFLESIEKQNWINEATIDRSVTYCFDCRIEKDGFIYIGFEQKIIYYKEWRTNLTNENLRLLAAYNMPKDFTIIETGFGTDTALEEFYRDDKYVYEFPAIMSQYVEVRYSNGTTENIKDALKRGIVKVNDLNYYGIYYHKKTLEGSYVTVNFQGEIFKKPVLHHHEIPNITIKIYSSLNGGPKQKVITDKTLIQIITKDWNSTTLHKYSGTPKPATTLSVSFGDKSQFSINDGYILFEGKYYLLPNNFEAQFEKYYNMATEPATNIY